MTVLLQNKNSNCWLRTMQHIETSWCWPWCCISIEQSIISW